MSDAREQAPQWVQILIQVLIVYSVVTIALETMPELAGWSMFFEVSNVVVVAIFTVEYFAFWWYSDDRLRYPLRLTSIIDLLAILPFYLALGIDLRFVRSVRLLRAFRILKLARYSRALRTLGEAFRRTAPELAVIGFAAAIVIVISSMMMYYAEHEAQPNVYTSIPASLWWAVVTLTTVGYGDVYPVTLVGRLVATIVMLLGIGLIALPTGIISSAMTEIIRENRERARDQAGRDSPQTR